MKPYQGILAWIGYLIVEYMTYTYISETYDKLIAGIIELIAFGWLLHKKQMLPMSSRDLKGSQLLFCLGIGLGLALFFKISILFAVLSGAQIDTQPLANPFFFAVSMATTVVLVPVAEELLFRGILFGSFSRSISYKMAMVLSALFFMLVHYMVSWPSVFVMGVLSAWIYWRTDNLAVTMVIHCAINLGSLLSTPLYILLAAHRAIGVAVCLFVVLLGILITCLSTRKFLQKHDACNE